MVLVQNSQRSREFYKVCPPSSSDDLCIFFGIYPSSMVLQYLVALRKDDHWRAGWRGGRDHSRCCSNVVCSLHKKIIFYVSESKKFGLNKFCSLLHHSFSTVIQIKGIVSRDWGGLQMILLDRLEVFNISASCFFFFLPFSYSIFKNGRLSGASFQHSSSKDQYKSGDSNSLV